VEGISGGQFGLETSKGIKPWNRKDPFTERRGHGRTKKTRIPKGERTNLLRREYEKTEKDTN